MHISEQNRNTDLAKALQHRKIPAVVQCTGVLKDHPSEEPDILVSFSARSPVLIECKYEGKESSLLRESTERLGRFLVSDVGELRVERVVMCQYPKELETGGEVEDATLRAAVLMGASPDLYQRFPVSGWMTMSVHDLADLVEMVGESVPREVSDNVIAAVDAVAGLLNLRTGGDPATRQRIASLLHQEAGEQANGMAATILVNACLFHDIAAGAASVARLPELRVDGYYPQKKVLDTWAKILKHNYFPIFRIALDIVSCLPTGVAQEVIGKASDAVSVLSGKSMVTVGDLTGQVFGKLIVDREYLAANYTLPESAALLAGLAIRRLDLEWENPEAVLALRIGDLACGTGALLSAAYGQIRARMRRAGLDDGAHHKAIIENSLIGADVLPAAAHLTLTILAAAHPSVTFDHTRIAKVGLGEHPESREELLGSLDLANEGSTPSLWGAGRTAIGGKSETTDIEADQPLLTVREGELDLAIMNPPYVRNTKNEGDAAGVFLAAFAAFGIPESVRKRMAAKLEVIRKQEGSVGNGHAGLGSDFAGLAHQKTRPGGTIALVLPDTFLSTRSWGNARRLLLRDCADPMIIVHGKGTRSFSADTGIAEVLVVARKPLENEIITTELITCVILNRRPDSLTEAAETARAIAQAHELYGQLKIGGDQIGGYVKSERPTVASRPDTALASSWLEQGQPTLPRGMIKLDIPICRLGDLGERGPDSSAVGYSIKRGIPKTAHNGRDRYAGPFQIDHPRDAPTYPTLWNNNAKQQTTVRVSYDSEALPRPGHETRAAKVWARAAGTLHYNTEFRLTSQSLGACQTIPCIGGRAWPSFFPNDPKWGKPLCLWANTTLGLMAHWWIGSHQQKGRSIVATERLQDLSALDCRELTDGQLNRLGCVFDDFKDRPLLPAHEAWHDPTRQALDRAVFEALGLQWESIADSLKILRLQWCSEPTVHGDKTTGRPPSKYEIGRARSVGNPGQPTFRIKESQT